MRCKDCPDYQECVRRHDLRAYRMKCDKAKETAPEGCGIAVPDMLRAIRRLKVETGSLACFGCGYEHNCGIHGCTILREAERRLTLGMVAHDGGDDHAEV